METLEDIYRRYLDFVFRICCRYTKDAREADDLTQDVFVKISLQLGKFRGEAKLSTWIYRLAANCCLDHLRKKKREGALQAEDLEVLVVQNLNSHGDRVLAKIDLEKILEPLRPNLRRILFLTLAEGLSYAETAEVMNLKAGAVAKSVGRFLKKARQRRLETAPSKIPAADRLKVEPGIHL